MRSDSVQTRDLLLTADSSILTSKPENRNHHHHQYHRHYCHRSNDDIIRCPHHVALPDSEWGHTDSNFQLRSSYQVIKSLKSKIRPR